ncbi:2-keto-4-pentenoate hydratase [Microbaculum marinisediminis]|uniref:Fumarylacetoacetate hydrolase family protein n=1 Tax=Microbaculum marinisediminis TaxID=2931392 RepID=A0AAW5QQD4_9HYPH|nr:fumarylacetoacetate hydrolase family protein [Microbaculum sp. A6E488]MCT8970286.1 fumarylacetoacetate hydrolase family protein [Microbaculum sp. A6E488]
MTAETENALGLALADARLEGQPIDPGAVAAAGDWPPADAETAERIGEIATQAMGEPVAGWKIGATSPEAQAIMGCDGPFLGPLFAPRIHADGTTIPYAPGTLGVECEFAFRIGTKQPTGKADYDATSVAALVMSCHPALEIVGRRTRGDAFPGVTEAIADFALNVAFVHGPAIMDWQDVDLGAAEVRGLVDGQQTNAGHGRNVLGHPLNALAWLANALALRGNGLRPGDWVSTGTCLGVVPAAAGTTVSGDYGPLGRVAVTFEG